MRPRAESGSMLWWRLSMGLSKGDRTTYGEIAEKIGRLKASRAVAGACAANPGA